MQVPLLHVTNPLMPAHGVLDVWRYCRQVKCSRKHVRDWRIGSVPVQTLSRLRNRVRPVASSGTGFPSEIGIIENAIAQANSCAWSQQVGQTKPRREIVA